MRKFKGEVGNRRAILLSFRIYTNPMRAFAASKTRDDLERPQLHCAAAAGGGDGVQLPLRTCVVPQIVILRIEYSTGRAACIVD